MPFIPASNPNPPVFVAANNGSHARMTPTESMTRSTFIALMWALSRPGRVHLFPPNGEGNGLTDFIAVGKTLLDLETSFYANHMGLARELAQTGSREESATRAAYLFFSRLRESDLESVEQAAMGDYLYPDRSATLVIGCEHFAVSEARAEGVETATTPSPKSPSDAVSASLRLTGPGIPRDAQLRLRVAGIPPAFWALRGRLLRYPLGFDTFLLWNHGVIGLPRTTHVEWEVA